MQVFRWDKTILKKIGRETAQLVDKNLFKKINRIITEVQKSGDTALRRFTREFDGVDLPLKRLRVSEGDINHAYQKTKIDLVSLLKFVKENIAAYYEKELRQSFKIELQNGTKLGKLYRPIERIGVYIPGGTAPLISTAYMTVVPAQIAGVPEIAIVSPPNRETGDIDPHILVAADLLGVKEIYRAGGAQAIAALAFGTRTIKKVDKIVGPGNMYVAEAKRQVFGYVDIDMVAGPSEIAIIADKTANPTYVTCDLLSQTEHYAGTAVLVTNSKPLCETMRKRIDAGYIILVDTLDEACEVVNEIAPEHLEIMTSDPEKLLKKIKNAGAIFLGDYTPTVVGDYVAGPSHVLPTGGTARYFSPLSTSDFIKSSQTIFYTKENLSRVRPFIRQLADIEGLVLHRISMESRFADLEKKEADSEKKRTQ